ncbi:hypothetical protein, partial [Kineococcus glutinatus]|uniref:hypothetical protein n=1 Tax=Kineococcus glutinatus TaxID=1070872 RepID=UPI0031F13B82
AHTGTAAHDGGAAGDHAADGHAEGGPSGEAAAALGGLEVARGGYALHVPAALPAGPATTLAFRISGPDGQPVTAYDTAHEEDLHLFAVRRDTAGYQHVHPVLAADGTWSVPLALTPGDWRVVADFDPAGGPATTLGADVAVAGAYEPQPLPAPSTTAVVDGYTVTLTGRLVPGEPSALTLSVSRAGRPVTDLQPYLGAYGHLVALRVGDLGMLHVHPDGDPGRVPAGPDITFTATAPSAGDHRLALDFRHGDVVRTAQFTVRAGDPAPAPVTPTAPAAPAPAAADGHDHQHEPEEGR